MTRSSVGEGIKENYYEYHEFLMKYTLITHFQRAVWLSVYIPYDLVILIHTYAYVRTVLDTL